VVIRPTPAYAVRHPDDDEPCAHGGVVGVVDTYFGARRGRHVVTAGFSAWWTQVSAYDAAVMRAALR